MNTNEQPGSRLYHQGHLDPYIKSDAQRNFHETQRQMAAYRYGLPQSAPIPTQPVELAPMRSRGTTGLPWYMHTFYAVYGVFTLGYGWVKWFKRWAAVKKVTTTVTTPYR